MDDLSADAPAKINLILEVLGKRDDGYHEIDTVLQTVALCDRVTVSFGGQRGVRITGPRAAGVPADETNGAWRAAEALAAMLGRDISALGIAIEKHIPAAGGLGGGSSDAATTLRLLQRAWPEVTEAQLLEAALSVGSDEAFFLKGGTARARGRGEIVTPLATLPEHGVVLFVPEATLDRKTARLFGALAKTRFDEGGRAARFAASQPSQLTVGATFNAFERVGFEAFDGLAELRASIMARVGSGLRLSGAGPTLFWIGPKEEAVAVARECAGMRCEVLLTATTGPAAV